jgi:hypothetical protein
MRVQLCITAALLICVSSVGAQSSLWQLTFTYSPEGLSLLRAAPIPPTAKKVQTPGLAGALLKLEYDLEWRNANGEVLFSRRVEIPLGTRSALGPGPAGGHELEMPESGALVIRVEGPNEALAPTSIRLIKVPERAGLLPIRPLVVPQAFQNAEHQFDVPPRELLKASGQAAGLVGSIKLRDNGPDTNRLVLVMMGDGFTQADLNAGRWANPVNIFVGYLFDTSPWDEYQAGVNLYRVDIASNEAGADYEDGPPGVGHLRDTYFDASFSGRCVYLSAAGVTRAAQAADATVGVGLWDEILVFVNSSTYGGCAGGVAVSSLAGGYPDILTHELGHSFGNLIDEYEGEGDRLNCQTSFARNIDCGTSLPHVRWDAWVTPGTPIPTPEDFAYQNVVGAFEGAAGFDRGVYRPMLDCKMRNLFRPFCPICKEAHVVELFNRVNLLDRTFPPPGAVTVPANGSVTFVLTPIHVGDLFYSWSLDGSYVSGSSSATISGQQLTRSVQELRVTVTHFSPLVRSDIIQTSVRWTLSRALTGPVNSWTKSSSGAWEEPFWSLGELPSLKHGTIAITNAGFKAVGIGRGTVVNFPGSVTISNLVVSAPAGSGNLLLMNYSGPQTPLRVLNDFRIEPNGHLLHLYAGLRVEGRDGGGFFVDGLARHAELASLVANRVVVGSENPGQYHFTNGTFTASNLTVGAGASGVFSQWGGSVQITNEMDLGPFPYYSSPSARGDYSLHAGTLSVPLLDVRRGSFAQAGGTNRSEYVYLADASYELAAGSLLSSRVQAQSPPYDSTLRSRFIQRGGSHQCKGSILLAGFPGADYQLDAGRLSAGSVYITWWSRFIQNGGTNAVESLQLDQPAGQYYLSGGLLNTTHCGIGVLGLLEPELAVMVQDGGVHRVSDQLTAEVGVYQLKGGTLIASNILFVTGRLRLQGGGLINPGVVTMQAGVIAAEQGTVNFGPLALSVNFLFGFGTPRVEFTNAPAAIRFADSSAIPWSNGVALVIQNWAGSLQGGGAHQVSFGTTATGLTPQQLGQVFFSNPRGLPPGIYNAQLLPNGEAVPDGGVSLRFTRRGDHLVFEWPAFFQLETATNVTGPYSSLFTGSPYTNLFSDSQRFFRLRSQQGFQ